MFPAVALSEYLWKADLAELTSAIQKVVGGAMFAPPFNDATAVIASDLGRRYANANGGKLSDVAKTTSHDRTALKYDLLIVATAVEHQAQFFLTRDAGCHRIAQFAGLNSFLIDQLPDPPPPPAPPPPKPASPPPAYRQPDIFEMLTESETHEQQSKEPKPEPKPNE